jgi:hypothetical protein
MEPGLWSPSARASISIRHRGKSCIIRLVVAWSFATARILTLATDTSLDQTKRYFRFANDAPVASGRIHVMSKLMRTHPLSGFYAELRRKQSLGFWLVIPRQFWCLICIFCGIVAFCGCGRRCPDTNRNTSSRSLIAS